MCSCLVHARQVIICSIFIYIFIPTFIYYFSCRLRIVFVHALYIRARKFACLNYFYLETWILNINLVISFYQTLRMIFKNVITILSFEVLDIFLSPSIERKSILSRERTYVLECTSPILLTYSSLPICLQYLSTYLPRVYMPYI